MKIEIHVLCAWLFITSIDEIQTLKCKSFGNHRMLMSGNCLFELWLNKGITGQEIRTGNK